jgi:hypothetical protein
MCVDSCSDEFLEVAEYVTDCTDTDRTGDLCRLVANVESRRLDALGQLRAPHLAIPSIAALEQNHQRSALEAAADVSRMHTFSYRLGELRQYLF